MPLHNFVAMTLLDFGSRKSAEEAEQYFGFQAISGNYNPEGTNLMDVPGAPGWPLIPDMSIYFDDAKNTSMTYADALCRFVMPQHSPYTYDTLITPTPTVAPTAAPSTQSTQPTVAVEISNSAPGSEVAFGAVIALALAAAAL